MADRVADGRAEVDTQPPGAGQAPSLDALLADGRLRRRPRDPDHRPRRGLLRLRRARQPLPRRPLGALLRQRRPRPQPSSARRRRARSSELDFYTLWSYAHPRAIELAARIASLAPGDLNRVFFTSGGSEAVESALKLARNYHRMRGNGQKHKVIAREIAYHGTSLGALSATGITELRSQFEPLAPGGCHVPNTNIYRWPEDRDPLWAADRDRGADPVRGAGDGRRRDPRAGPERRRLLRPPGGLLPAGPRDLRPLRRAADLRRGDLRLGPPRPLLRLRALRLPARHRHDRQGADLGLRADGRADRLRPGRRAVHARATRPSPTASPSPATRVAAAIAMANLDVFEREDLCGHVLRQGGRVPRDARDAARHPDRRRRARRRLLPGDRAGQGQGDEGELQRRGVRGPAARLPLRRALQAGPDLPRRRPR